MSFATRIATSASVRDTEPAPRTPALAALPSSCTALDAQWRSESPCRVLFAPMLQEPLGRLGSGGGMWQET